MSHNTKGGLTNLGDDRLRNEFEGIIADSWEYHYLLQEMDDRMFEIINRLERLKFAMTGEHSHDPKGGLEAFVVPTEKETCSFGKDSAQP